MKGNVFHNKEMNFYTVIKILHFVKSLNVQVVRSESATSQSCLGGCYGDGDHVVAMVNVVGS